METMTFIVDGHHGIYVPQYFAHLYSESKITGVDWESLSKGPYHDSYWDAWDLALNNASFTDSNGHKWTLYPGESGDLFVVRDDHDWEKEE